MKILRVVALMVLALVPLSALAAPPPFILRWGSYGTDPGQFRFPGGLATDPQGNLYVADTDNGRIQKFDGEGHLLAVIGSPGSGPGQLAQPSDVEIGADGNVYVADAGNTRIQVFTQSGAWLRMWGSDGVGPGQFGRVTGITSDVDGNIFVSDPGSSRIQKFTPNGDLLAIWDPPDLEGPEDIEVGPDGNIYLIDGASVFKFSPNGLLLLKWGPGGLLSQPLYLAVDDSNFVWITDAGGYQAMIFKYTSSGVLRDRWGVYGLGEGQFTQPSGIQTDHLGNLYIAESRYDPGRGPQNIQKFGSLPTAVRPMLWGELKRKYR